jgi:hypothetical protein
MATNRARYLSNLYKRKYGAIGEVASKYIEAGYSVEFMYPTRYGAIHIVARGNNQVFAIEVFDKPSTISIDVVNSLLEKSKLIKAKPILAIYSNDPRLTDDVYRFCVENGIKIKRVKK